MTERRKSTYVCDRCKQKHEGEEEADTGAGFLSEIAVSSCPMTWLSVSWNDEGPHGPRYRTMHFCDTCKPRVLSELQSPAQRAFS